MTPKYKILARVPADRAMVSGHAEHPAGRKTKGTRGDAYRACRRGQEGAGGKAVKSAWQRVSQGIGGEGCGSEGVDARELAKSKVPPSGMCCPP